ncbi:MAG: dynamin family protein [Bacteroidota bacterium]
MTKKKIASTIMPIVHSTHQQEDDSRIIFQQCIKPWMIINWFHKDYGIDANIEIQRALTDTSHQIATGKRFSMQLKSSDKSIFDKDTFTLSVDRDKITYWYRSVEPVMLAYVDLDKKAVYYLWIDETLIQNLHQKNTNWLAQETVSVQFSGRTFITNAELPIIEKYVLQWKRPLKTILTPGNYFKYSQEAKKIVNTLIDTIAKHDISFLKQDLGSLTNDSEKSIYTIAIVGPSRVGKSTLINSLLHKEISPVDVLPTTGIPISIFPFNENKTTILFKDSSQIQGGIGAAFLNEYTSQKGNPKNNKNVKYVSVNIINGMLEKGLSLCDVPGLDDPDPVIRGITKTAVYNVNAIVYVISVASYNDGEFSITKNIVEDLIELGGLMDKVFIVFNKTDKLTESQLVEVKVYINDKLNEYDILKYLPCEPIYISSQRSFDKRVKNENIEDSVQLLEKEIWAFLLTQNKTGLHKILSILSTSKGLIDKYKNIINTRLLDSKKRKDLDNKISYVKKELHSLNKLIKNVRYDVANRVKDYTQNSFANVLAHLLMDLGAIPLANSLPPKERITKFLEENAYKIITDVNTEFQQCIFEMQSEVNSWVAEKLNQVELALHNEDENVEIQTLEVTKYTNQIFSFFQERKEGYIGILESVIGIVASAIEILFSTIEILLTSPEKVRQNDIKTIHAKATKGYNKIQTEFLKSITGYLNSICRKVEQKALDRANVYLGELSKQIQSLEIPLTNHQIQNFESFLGDIKELSRNIESEANHLKDYTDSIEWSK